MKCFLFVLCLIVFAAPMASAKTHDVGRTWTPMAIDGNLSDWTGFAMTAKMDDIVDVIGGYDDWSDANDLSVKLRMAYDNTNLYFCVEAKDDRIVNISPDTQPFSGDCAELGINGWLITLGARTTGNLIVTQVGGSGTSLPGLLTVFATAAGGYTIEGVVPLASIGVTPVVGGTCPLDLAVYDNDRDPAQIGFDTTMGLSSDSDRAYVSTATWRAATLLADKVQPTPPQLLYKLGEIKNVAVGSLVEIWCLPITLVMAADHYFFVQDNFSFTGVRVNWPDSMAAVHVGGVISRIVGHVALRDGMVQVDADMLQVAEGVTFDVKPMSVSTQRLGGSSVGIWPAVGGPGPSNVGLLITASGRVTGSITGGFELDGIPVYSTAAQQPTVGQCVAVTGVCVTRTGDSARPAIQAADNAVTITQEGQ